MTVERVALVTGAARGIGAAVVRRLAQEGCHVVALDWCIGDEGSYPQGTRADLEAVAAHYDGRVVTHVGDVRDPAVLQAAVATALERWGRLDVTVAAAAVVRGGGPLWETTQEDMALLWDVDVKGVWHTATAAVPAMLAGQDPSSCRFVAIASAAASRGLFHLSAYNIVKHAVVGLVRGLAADLVGTGVTVTAVSPGSTATDMLAETAGLYGVPSSELARNQLIRRLITPEEVAAAVAFCCSREGAVVNGAVLPADGGFSG